MHLIKLRWLFGPGAAARCAHACGSMCEHLGLRIPGRPGVLPLKLHFLHQVRGPGSLEAAGDRPSMCASNMNIPAASSRQTLGLDSAGEYDRLVARLGLGGRAHVCSSGLDSKYVPRHCLPPHTGQHWRIHLSEAWQRAAAFVASPARLTCAPLSDA